MSHVKDEKYVANHKWYYNPLHQWTFQMEMCQVTLIIQQQSYISKHINKCKNIWQNILKQNVKKTYNKHDHIQDVHCMQKILLSFS